MYCPLCKDTSAALSFHSVSSTHMWNQSPAFILFLLSSTTHQRSNMHTHKQTQCLLLCALEERESGGYWHEGLDFRAEADKRRFLLLISFPSWSCRTYSSSQWLVCLTAPISFWEVLLKLLMIIQELAAKDPETQRPVWGTALQDIMQFHAYLMLHVLHCIIVVFVTSP